MGGLVALLLALEADRDGDPIDALILYEPILHDLLDPAVASDAAALAWDGAIVSELAADVGQGKPEAGVSRFVEAWNETAWTGLPREVRRQLVAGAGRLVRQTASMLTKKLPPGRLAGLRTPTLLLGGDRSPAFTGLVLQRAVASIPKSRCVILEGAGHMGPLNAADRVAAAIGAWLEEQALD
jgi:pimeloyl-ACP methyl ester carboxylesterase